MIDWTKAKTAEQKQADAQEQMVAHGKQVIQQHLDATAQQYDLDTIHNIGKFVGYDNSRRALCEALGRWAGDCWDAGKALLAAGQPVTDAEIVAALPEFVAPG